MNVRSRKAAPRNPATPAAAGGRRRPASPRSRPARPAAGATGATKGSLNDYARKRNFEKTSEPRPRTRPPDSSGTGNRLLFVVQKHDASHLHYDFRLELDGVLKSWAVPKGPSINPQTKRLAVQVEDHPVDYASFEGTIPEGQYGGGTVMVWDTGSWSARDGDPRAALAKGHLSFTLHGSKLRGDWTLQRLPDRGKAGAKPAWLLIKRRDEHARDTGESIIDELPNSVTSGRAMEEIAGGGRTWQSNRPPRAPTGLKAQIAAHVKAVRQARAEADAGKGKKKSGKAGKGAKTAAPRAQGRTGGSARPQLQDPPLSSRTLRPQLCTPAPHVPSGDDWIHEIKFDGYRLLAFAAPGEPTQLITRRGLDWAGKFEPLADAASALCEAADQGPLVLDGEACIVDGKGRSSFQALQNAIKARRFANLAFFAFDLLYAGGRDLRKLPLAERKGLLAELLASAPSAATRIIRPSEHIAGKSDGAALQADACRLGLEGVVSKRASSTYEAGVRSRSWLKIKCSLRQEFVIVGFTPPEGSRKHFGSLLLAARNRRDQLVYTGNVGTGFTDLSLRDIGARLQASMRSSSPLDVPAPRADVRGATWVEPTMVAEVEFTEWTGDGRLRHPAFQGLREDKEAGSVRIETGPDAVTLAPSPPHSSSADADAATGGASSSAFSSGESRGVPRRPSRRTKAESAKPDKGKGAKAAAAPRRSKAGPVAPPPAPSGKAASTLVGTGVSTSAAKVAAPAKREEVVAGVRITNAQRILFPTLAVTKGDLARYYEAVAEVMLPFVSHRPLSTLRCPEGLGDVPKGERPGAGVCFFQKHPHQTLAKAVSSGALNTVMIKEKEATAPYLWLDSVEGLVTLVQFGVLEIHPWGSRVDALETPDRMIFDLDPGEDVSLDQVKLGAVHVRNILREFGLQSFLQTSGGKGFHVILPLSPGGAGRGRAGRARSGGKAGSAGRTGGSRGGRAKLADGGVDDSWDAVKEFGRQVAAELTRRHPRLYTDNIRKERRAGRTFVDYLRNGRGATSVASYSTRARPDAGVAMPIRWEEIESIPSPAAYTLANALEHLRRQRAHPWKGYHDIRQNIPAASFEQPSGDRS